MCHEIWKAEGYAVYGLAPTGKAAQNLEQSGIRSTTIHKFLKDVEAGRAQYVSRSVLVLDEAGMVDVERFSKLLSVVKSLGVKLTVVGDGAQLQQSEELLLKGVFFCKLNSKGSSFPQISKPLLSKSSRSIALKQTP